MNKLGLTASIALCLFVATQSVVATQDAKPKAKVKKPKPPKPKKLIKELRTAVKWMDRNSDVISDWLANADDPDNPPKRHADLSDNFQKKNLLSGQLVLSLDPENLRDQVSTWPSPPLSVVYLQKNPVTKPLKYYSLQSVRERGQQYIDTAGAKARPAAMKAYNATLERLRKSEKPSKSWSYSMAHRSMPQESEKFVNIRALSFVL